MSSAELRPDAPIALPAQCGTAAAEGLRGALLRAAQSGPIRIDASQVSNLGQAVLQLLLAARRTAETSGMAFDIAAPSSAFSDTLARCQLAEALGQLPAQGVGA